MTENKSTRKCAIYCRVSTEEQNLDQQENILKKYAFEQNYKVYQIYKEKISSRKDSRPELNEMLFDMRHGYFDTIIVYKLDRLGRSLKHLLNLCEEFYNRGVDLVCTSQNIDTSTASGKLLFNILGSVAEFECKLISERTKLGLRGKKNVGKRGKDKQPRRTSGYHLRYQKKGGMKNAGS